MSTLKINEPGKCTGCGMCVEVCPHDVFAVIESKRSPKYTSKFHR